MITEGGALAYLSWGRGRNYFGVISFLPWGLSKAEKTAIMNYESMMSILNKFSLRQALSVPPYHPKHTESLSQANKLKTVLFHVPIGRYQISPLNIEHDHGLSLHILIRLFESSSSFRAAEFKFFKNWAQLGKWMDILTGVIFKNSFFMFTYTKLEGKGIILSCFF